MRLAVADIQDAGGVHEDAVRPRHLTLKRIGFGAVATPAGADDRADDAGVEVHPADDVIFGVGDVEHAIGTKGKPLRPAELRRARLTAVPRVSLLTGTGHVM